MPGGIGAAAQVQAHTPGAESEWQVYILECADGSLYTGIARNLQRRLAQHNGDLAGGPRYTRGRRPVTLRWCDAAADRSTALRREAAIKRLSRDSKLALIRSAAGSA
ncbi:GIY-YIG nuclease family protein [Parahaliea aestuarii]|uniref:GIY-YIG nuclease family protein n=1 Tax=Parahaliea aestuarii TaxID=1852021 RepID=A0A5C8ZQ13_9GAMM|nr:GIY-YIG nuclease family protein [Parahaliea aestuarii]TXS90518.1 GIY-YIG nuclease family protein [Parahaliea aestuarii]